MKFHPFLIILFLFFFLNNNGLCQIIRQDENTDLRNFLNINPKTISGNNFFLNIENNNFFKNNEYFNGFYEGKTLIGYYLKPEIYYKPSNNILLRAGGHFLKYSGLDKYSSVIPTFSFEYKINKRLELIMGTIRGNLEHKLPEPLYQQERFYTNNVENGIQLLYNSKYIISDLWINWMKFINNGDPFQEEFALGSSTLIRALELNNKMLFSIPVYFLLTHKGGQINKSNKNVQTLLNLSSGLEFTHLLNFSIFRSFGVKGLYYSYSDHSHNSYLEYTRGNAYSIDLNLSADNFYFSVGYWNSFKFFAPLGEPLYHSIVPLTYKSHAAQRHVITNKIIYRKEIKKYLLLGLRYEQYFDVKMKTRDYSYSVFLVFKNQFFKNTFGGKK